MTAERNMIDLEYEWFKKKINEIAGVDLDGYKPEQMKRLLSRAMDQAGAKNYVDYVKQLKSDPELVREFRDRITINVSCLFRDAEKWRELDKLLPGLVRDTMPARKRDAPEFRALSVGCSIGAEPVSLAVLLSELNASDRAPAFDFEILAIDIDQSILQRARDGVFTDKDMEQVPPRLLEKYFREIPRPPAQWAQKSSAASFFAANRGIMSRIEYKFQNLLDSNWDKGFNLIVCRNVLIYFNRKVIEELVARFSESLLPGGILFIGSTELIFTPQQVGLKPIVTSIYRKNA